MLTALSFVIVQALLGAATGHLLGGLRAAVLGGLVVAAASLATLALSHRTPAGSAYRQVILAAILIALHVAALYTVGDDGHTVFPGAFSQLLAAAVGLVACAGLARRLRATMAMSPVPERRTVLVEDDDDRTLELEPASPLVVAEPAPATRTPPPIDAVPRSPFRSPLTLGIVSTALFVVATLLWIGDDGRHEGLGGNAVAQELPSRPSAMPDAVISPPATSPMDASALPVSTSSAGAGPELPSPADTGTPTAAAGGTTALAPSAARRECMAQIESAHLFLQLARQAGDESQYALATQEQIARMLKDRPVGPKTLARIAERMWATRAAPERDAAWWASQFSRCEAARSGGSWYVVKG